MLFPKTIQFIWVLYVQKTFERAARGEDLHCIEMPKSAILRNLFGYLNWLRAPLAHSSRNVS
jgi:hypothetical protein